SSVSSLYVTLLRPPAAAPLSLHDALPISRRSRVRGPGGRSVRRGEDRPGPMIGIIGGSGLYDLDGLEDARPPHVLEPVEIVEPTDRKSTRLNSSHVEIAYAGFCFKKKHTK